MYKLRIYSKPKPIKMKCSATFPPIILANLQEKETIPTKETQEIVADKTYDGLSKVTVHPIPNEYIVPSGEVEFTQNGTYDVTDKASAKVNIKEKVLGTKTITSNGTYKAIDDNLDGYSEVEVSTSGVDINEYMSDEIISGDLNLGRWMSLIKKLRNPITIKSTSGYRGLFKNFPGDTIPELISLYTQTDASSMFNTARNIKTIPSIDTSNITNMSYMFSECSNLLSIPSIDTSNATDMNYMFNRCSKLTSIPQLDTSKNQKFQSFIEATPITNITLDISSCTTMRAAFRLCDKLKKVNLINDNGTITEATEMFYGCFELEELPSLNTHNIIYMSYFYYSGRLPCHFLAKKMPKYNLAKCISIGSFTTTSSSATYDLEDLGGFENLGQAYSTTTQANYGNYTLTISRLTNLTEQSIINVLTNLYDIATKGVKPQTVTLGSTNLAKLTSEEGQAALAQAQQFGWNIN